MKSQKAKVKSQNYRAKVKNIDDIVSEGGGSAYEPNKDFELLPAREGLGIRSYKFAVAVVRFVDRLETRSAQFSIRDQLIRAATSVGANIVEARAANSKRDFIRFYEIALKSSNETKFRLCLLRDAFDIDKSRIEPLLNEATELSNIIATSVLTMKNKR